MHRIGAHVSIAGGVDVAPGNARKIGATAFAIFVKNPRGYACPPLADKIVDLFLRAMEEHEYLSEHVVPHAGYLINLGSPKEDIQSKSFQSFMGELRRCEQLGLRCLNIHPGSHSGEEGEERCLNRIADSINRALSRTNGVMVLLENTAGQGASVGYKFEHLAQIFDLVEDKSRIGICIDTCHSFSAGYDLRSENAYLNTMAELDRIVGLKYLKALHLNDAKGELGGRLDRHQSLGQGNLGWETFSHLMNDSRLDEIPMVLETIDDTIWDREIENLYGLIRNESVTKRFKTESADFKPKVQKK